MSLATRCPACGTVFRVVQDQLKVSEGWVRCGRCSEVFNAVESLFDLEREAPPPWQGAAGDSAPAPFPSPTPPAGDADSPRRDASAPATTVAGGDVRSHGLGPEPRSGPAPQAPARPAGELAADAPSADTAADVAPWHTDPEDTGDAAMALAPARPHDGQHDESPPPPPQVPPPQRHAAAAAAFERREPSLQELPSDISPPPRFLVQAERERKASAPAARLAWLLASVLLTVLAIGQAAYGGRDLIAAHWPAARAALDPMCDLLGCRIEPLRRIQGLTVDGSGLSKLETGTLYRLTLLLHNRDAVPLRLPALDLTLTDAQGLVVARKVLDAAALGATQPAIGAGTELPLQAVLDPGSRRVVGYTIDIFYP